MQVIQGADSGERSVRVVGNGGIVRARVHGYRWTPPHGWASFLPYAMQLVGSKDLLVMCRHSIATYADAADCPGESRSANACLANDDHGRFCIEPMGPAAAEGDAVLVRYGEHHWRDLTAHGKGLVALLVRRDKMSGGERALYKAVFG